MLLGNPLITPQRLATIIRTKVLPMARKLKTASGAKHANRRAFRTKAVKKVLRQTARKFRGLKVFPNDDRRLKKRSREWLFDLVWWNDIGRRKGVELAVESEWNSHPDEVLYDFEKLLGIKAPLKLMIYRTTGETRPKVQERIETYLYDFRHHIAGENYVICEFQSEKWRCYLYKITCDGCIPRPRRVVLFEK